MKEVVRRRYQRAIVEETPLPDLIITDGGKGQMEVVREVIQDELHLDIPIAGLAKDGKHRTSELLVRLPSRNDRHADTKFHVQILHANTGRGASFRHHFP